MSLRIAFDLDGVLADMDRTMGRHAAALFDAPARTPPPDDEASEPGPLPLPNSLSLTSGQQKALWKHVRSIENFWESLDEVEAGVVGRLAETVRALRWEIIFLTSRPSTAGDTSQLQTQRWLEGKGFPRPSVFVVTGSRGRIATALALDVVVDDRIENCMDVVADSKARAILVWRADRAAPAAAAALHIEVAPSTDASLDALTRDAAKVETGPFNRMLKFLGLKEAAVD